MFFITDQQTMYDLNIFSRHTYTSLYSMFNLTLTRGGAKLMEQMFRRPLSDIEAINGRINLIRYFSSNPAFPFYPHILEIAEKYLENSDERTRLYQEDDFFGRSVADFIAADAKYESIHDGVVAWVTIINAMDRYVASELAKGESPYDKELSDIGGLLATIAAAKQPKNIGKRRLAFTFVAELDSLFRFRKRETLEKLLFHIYSLDVYIAVGRVATERGFCYPKAQVSKNCNLVLAGAWPAHIPGAKQSDLRFTVKRNVVLLTGSNKAGKSTFMRALGAAAYLAHMGFPVAARRMEFSVLDGMYSTIDLPANLGTGASHLYSEVVRLKKLVLDLNKGKKLLVITDNLFRNTNVEDAYACTIGLVERFAKKKKGMFLISTHITEVGRVLRRSCPNVGLYYFPTFLSGSNVVYTYELAAGLDEDRHGMIMLDREGVISILAKEEKKNL